MAATASGTSRVEILRDGDTFTVDGRRFRLNVERDDMGPPWEEHDMHGVVSNWTTRPKTPGERVLSSDGAHKRYYDFQASVQIARTVWGITEGAKAAEAVEADFKRLRAWCHDEWYWTYIRVTLLDGRDSGEFDGVGGVESDSEEYISECAHELARELLSRVVTFGGRDD